MKTPTKKPAYVIRYRGHSWYDTSKNVEMFGIQANTCKGVWQHVAENGKLLLFASAAKRDEKLGALKKGAKAAR